MLLLALVSVATVLACATATPLAPVLPRWDLPRPDPNLPLGGLELLLGAEHVTVFVSSPATGTYNHGAMIARHGTSFHIMWKNRYSKPLPFSPQLAACHPFQEVHKILHCFSLLAEWNIFSPRSLFLAETVVLALLCLPLILCSLVGLCTVRSMKTRMASAFYMPAVRTGGSGPQPPCCSQGCPPACTTPRCGRSSCSRRPLSPSTDGCTLPLQPLPLHGGRLAATV